MPPNFINCAKRAALTFSCGRCSGWNELPTGVVQRLGRARGAECAAIRVCRPCDRPPDGAGLAQPGAVLREPVHRHRRSGDSRPVCTSADSGNRSDRRATQEDRCRMSGEKQSQGDLIVQPALLRPHSYGMPQQGAVLLPVLPFVPRTPSGPPASAQERKVAVCSA